ncbi:hypothetical protein LTR56_018846 [Elasticomyces elasticus]|nr:hypothetical protein LTR22_026116 [Elasticomyces elasticus]KAK3628109.1 hypothetical protein LTR56_018846 [Elasticomyces elasticus]KAK4903950.1 hypothetical protein LTR49_026508 [Elasticomyces elasticus]KAK5738386.1 hypothetical protein LTS12_025614 [Elasticomyces elasticus]
MPENKSANAALAGLERGGNKLSVAFAGKAFETGQYIPRAGTCCHPDCHSPCPNPFHPGAQSAPTLSLPNANGTYLAVCLDMDAPFLSVPILGPIAHWIQPDYKPDTTSTADTLTCESGSHIIDYIGPAPPPGSGPHRYCFFLYEQPADFDARKHRSMPEGQQVGVRKRMFYSLDAFERQAKLGPIVACNYFTSN